MSLLKRIIHDWLSWSKAIKFPTISCFAGSFTNSLGDVNPVLPSHQRCLGGWGQRLVEPLDVHGRESAATEPIVLENLESKVPWHHLFIAAVGVPGEFIHCLGSCTVVSCLEGDAFWSDVPEPPARGAVCDRELMVELFIQTDNESFKILAVRIRVTQADLEYAMLSELVMDIANMVSLY
ncbi:hypothetical protein INS49_012066 [Diaporthe citri]|uniref:uncharacterized protein n=1 Tax=Diaporthe citri TaxID=83186 RepID=UPI001C7F2508|nr:uncharacterized protein INS49_012066 [Diaporthe citri]KAG6358549.1 hypothetical protein INS49_012066 [Diaporthe citri]